jgi:hypothetical protein
MIAAVMLALTALATLPAIASEEDSLEWTSVTIQCGRTPEAGEISCEARTGEMGWAACTVRAFGKEYVLPEAALAKLKGFPLSSLETTHEAGYEELGGYTVHFRFARTIRNPENKVVTEIIYISVNKNGISVSEPRPKASPIQGNGAVPPRVAPDKPELLPLPERIRTALANKHAAALWDYLTAPDTPHSERVAAALHWSKFLSLDELAKVRSALAELSKEADIHGFGLEQNPLDCSIAHLPSLAEMPDAERRRVIFGHVWMVPKHRDKYPDDMSQAPWPMQVTVALDRLQGWSINRLVAIDNGKPWLDDAMTMPCNTDVQATEFVRRMGRAFVFMGPAHLRRWRDIALNPAFPGAGVEVADALAGGLLSCSGEKRLLGRALYIELLQQRPLTRMTYDLAYYLYGLRTCGSRNDPRRLPLPSPEVMAVAEIAIDRHVPEADRVAYAFAVCEVVDSPPFSSNRQLDRESKEVPILLRKFEEWYEANKEEFARQAAAEAPLLRDARKKLLDEEMAQGADTAASTPETVFASLVMNIGALATNHAELADFTEYVKRQESRLAISYSKNRKPFPLTSAKNDAPVISIRRIRPSDLEANGIFLQFILDDGSDPRQATRQAPLDTVTYFPHLKKTLYAEVVLWQNASADLRQALVAILEKHKALLIEMDKQAANMVTAHDEQSQRFTMIWRETSIIPIEKAPTPQGFKVNPASAVKGIMGIYSRLPSAEFYLFVNSTSYYFGNTRKGVELTAPQPGHYVIDGMTGKITEPKPDGGKPAP